MENTQSLIWRIWIGGLSRYARRDLTDEDIRTAIKNSGGVKGSLLIPDAPFELLVRRAISELRSPCVQCKDFVHAELLRIATQCAPTDVARFPALQVRPFVLSAPLDLRGGKTHSGESRGQDVC